MAGIPVDSWNFNRWLEFQGNGWNFRGMAGISGEWLEFQGNLSRWLEFQGNSWNFRGIAGISGESQ
jgi:hypothetical protein